MWSILPLLFGWAAMGYLVYRIGPTNVIIGAQNLLRIMRDAALLPFDFIWAQRWMFLVISVLFHLLSLTALVVGLTFGWRGFVAISGLTMLVWLSFVWGLAWAIAKYLEWLDQAVLGAGGKTVFQGFVRFLGLLGLASTPDLVTDRTFRLLEQGALVQRLRSIVQFVMLFTLVFYLYLWAIPEWGQLFAAPSIILLAVAIIYFGILHWQTEQNTSGYLTLKRVTVLVLYGYLGLAAFSFVASRSDYIYNSLPKSTQAVVSWFRSVRDESAAHFGRDEYARRQNATTTMGEIIGKDAGLYSCVTEGNFDCRQVYVEKNGDSVPDTLPLGSKVMFITAKPGFQNFGEPVSEVMLPNKVGEFVGQQQNHYFVAARFIRPIAPVSDVNGSELVFLIFLVVLAILVAAAVASKVPRPWGAVTAALLLLLFFIGFGYRYAAAGSYVLAKDRAVRPSIFVPGLVLPPLYERWQGSIDPTQPWQTTKVAVKKGDTVRIIASGQTCWAHNANGFNCTGPEGTWYTPSQLDDQSDFPMLGAKCGSLIARIVDSQGNATEYAVGRATTFIAQQEGTIELMINDRMHRLLDNSGKDQVTVSSS